MVGNASTSLGSGFGAIYDCQTQTRLSPPLGHLAAANKIAFDSGQRYAVTCSEDATSVIWDQTPADFDLEHLRKLSMLVTSLKPGDGEQLVAEEPGVLEEMFRQESVANPGLFRCTASQIAAWESWVELVQCGSGLPAD